MTLKFEEFREFYDNFDMSEEDARTHFDTFATIMSHIARQAFAGSLNEDFPLTGLENEPNKRTSP
ncbi:hypothetical protein [Stakelama tenebrarum]|uniref:Uncharacterized protein n=1 Tax=Stakelama tenebrarum TaxID=2711215 RepID=A0A6G6Y5D0_9SPHN|nr:hypothetical protein [Sphingosinithalassobacter tenebrarum]QIG79928.1 hypothetical protein G5C33_09150 [Sphingosinithalassobacter tenebrarum]